MSLTPANGVAALEKVALLARPGGPPAADGCVSVLERLAAGAAGALETEDAKAALKRLHLLRRSKP
jgi:hypothetical protein